VLVDPKEYAEILWAAHRSPFEEWVAKGSLVRLEAFCEAKNIEWIQGVVTQVDNHSCQVKSFENKEESISFDACILCTGASSYWSGLGRTIPSTAEESTPEYRLQQMKDEGQKLLSADHVAIIGGGLIGTELAGDLAWHSAQKDSPTKVTIIHSTDEICPVMSKPAARRMRDMLEKLGVEIICNERATEKNNGQILLETSGKELKADVVVKTIGFRPVNEFLRSTFPDSLDTNGWIVTDDYGRIQNASNIFALGDCSRNLPDSGSVYMRVSEIYASNLHQIAMDPESPLDVLKPVTTPFVLLVNTAGMKQGVAYSSMFWTQYFLPWIKNATMFFMALRDEVGITQEMTLAD